MYLQSSPQSTAGLILLVFVFFWRLSLSKNVYVAISRICRRRMKIYAFYNTTCLVDPYIGSWTKQAAKSVP
uniref:Putative secreted protein n=1 Tax=Amblyomma cajennense TaxID=34607 RepID=A0A023FDC8_AMBCJ